MSDQSAPPERRQTGIPGLDRILDGGLLEAGVYIVQGPPGAGKTILANQACFHHASEGGRAVYITLLAESHSRMFGHLRRMAFLRRVEDSRVRVLRRRVQHARIRGTGRSRHAGPRHRHEEVCRAGDYRWPGVGAGNRAVRSGVQEVPARTADPCGSHALHRRSC